MVEKVIEILFYFIVDIYIHVGIKKKKRLKK